MASDNPFEPPGPDDVFDLGELERIAPGDLVGKPSPPREQPIIDDEDDAWAEFGSAGGGGGAGGSLDDPVIKARLNRLAPRVAVEPALDAILAASTRRRFQRRGGAVLSVAAVLLAVFLLAKAWPSGDEGDLVASEGGVTTYSTRYGSTINRGTFSPDELPPPTSDNFATLGSFVPGTYLPVFPTVPIPPIGTLPPQTTTTKPATTTTAAVTTTTKPPGQVEVTVTPRAASVAVGEQLTIDFVVKNNTNAAVHFQNQSCMEFGTATLGATADPVVGTGGTAFVGQAANVQDHIGDNALTIGWIPGISFIPSISCPAVGHDYTVNPGESRSTSASFDADAPPGGIPSSLVVAYKITIGGQVLSKTATVGFSDVSSRSANMAGVYAGVNAHAGVRAFLDQPGVSFKMWAGYHRGAWEFRFQQQDNGTVKTARVDASTGTVLSFA